jgi:bloom syndrome protein
MVDLGNVEGVTSAHCKHYGTKILGATIKHLKLQEKANGITPGAYGSRLPPTATRARASTAKSSTAAVAEGTPTQAPKSTKATTAKKATPAAPAPKQVVASIQSYAYKPNHGSTLPITAYGVGSGSNSGNGASGSGTGEKRITLNPSGRNGAARPKF